MAGDTPTSIALAGHLAGCPDCSAALAATRRTSDALRLVAAESPSPDLKARTLALVAAVGRPRGAAQGDAAPAGSPAGIAGRVRAALRGRPRRWALAAVGTAAVFGLLAAGSFVAADLQGQLDRTRQEAARLENLYTRLEALLQQPGARVVSLMTENGTSAGVLVLDAGSGQLAVMTDDLPAPPAGMEYRCWIEGQGGRQSVGRMWFEEGLAYWAGADQSIGGWAAGSTFGVSLEAVAQPSSQPPVLVGRL
jgi:hypothetical protein